MRLIDADDFMAQIAKRLEYIEQRREHLAKHLHFFMMDGAIAGELRRTIETIKNASTIDAVPVVRCKDCKEYEQDCGYCDYWEVDRNFDDHCSRGVRKMDGGAADG